MSRRDRALRELLRDPRAQAAALEQISVVDGWPEDADPHLQTIVDDLDQLDDLCVFGAEFDSYGSGWASFVEVKLTRRDGSSVRRRPDRYKTAVETVDTAGFGVLLNRLAPVAVLQGEIHESRSSDGCSAASLPGPECLVVPPIPDYPEAPAVVETLRRRGVTTLDPSDLLHFICPGLEPETNLGHAPWTVFDAWFHWFD